MSIEQIFKELSAHMLEGIMFHLEMTDYYSFLALRRYSQDHENHAKSEMTAYREICDYYMNHCNQFIEEPQLTRPEVVPQLWRTYKRQDVDVSARKQAVKNGVEKWISWETETKELYQRLYEELENIGELAAACRVLILVQDVDYELAAAQQKKLELDAVDYDMTYILERQDYDYC